MAHLTQAQRYTISCMLKQGASKSKIAKTIGKHKSVVGREIYRNADQRNGVYNDDLANRKYANRQKEKPKKIYFTVEVQKSVNDLLEMDYSPEQVVGTLRKQKKQTVSAERIYQYVWEDKKNGGQLYTHLRSHGKRYRKRGSAKDSRGIIQNRVSIENRPEIVDKRERFGDIEIDLIIGKNHKQAILTANDRASGMLKMKRIGSKNADKVAQAATTILKDWAPHLHTITSDNGKEFANHQAIADLLQVDYYFAHPYHSWERGSNENLNGLVRQYFPKGSDFTLIADDQIQEVEDLLNARPRKRFKFENPIFVKDKLLNNNKVAFVT